LGKFGGKFEILSTHIFCIGNMQLCVGKLQLPVLQPLEPVMPLRYNMCRFGGWSN